MTRALSGPTSGVRTSEILDPFTAVDGSRNTEDLPSVARDWESTGFGIRDAQ